MSVGEMVSLDLDDLPMDVFELADHGLVVESLTAGHGMTEMAASCCSCTLCSCSSSSSWVWRPRPLVWVARPLCQRVYSATRLNGGCCQATQRCWVPRSGSGRWRAVLPRWADRGTHDEERYPYSRGKGDLCWVSTRVSLWTWTICPWTSLSWPIGVWRWSRWPQVTAQPRWPPLSAPVSAAAAVPLISRPGTPDLGRVLQSETISPLGAWVAAPMCRKNVIYNLKRKDGLW